MAYLRRTDPASSSLPLAQQQHLPNTLREWGGGGGIAMLCCGQKAVGRGNGNGGPAAGACSKRGGSSPWTLAATANFPLTGGHEKGVGGPLGGGGVAFRGVPWSGAATGQEAAFWPLPHGSKVAQEEEAPPAPPGIRSPARANPGLPLRPPPPPGQRRAEQPCLPGRPPALPPCSALRRHKGQEVGPGRWR